VIKTVTGEPNPPGPDQSNPLPIFGRAFTAAKAVAKARLYVAGLGAYEATVNGKPVTDTVLNPGVTNRLRSVQYGTYDVTGLVKSGDNTLGVALGNGQTNVNPQANAPAGRSDVYTKFNSIPTPDGTLMAPAAAGDTTVTLDSVTGYAVGDTVTSTPATAAAAWSRAKVTAVGTNTLTVSPALSAAHATGAEVLGSGAPTKAEMAVTPRMIARLELTYADGSSDTIVSDRPSRPRTARRSPTTGTRAATSTRAPSSRAGTSPARTSPPPRAGRRPASPRPPRWTPSSCGARRRRCACRRRSSRCRSARLQRLVVVRPRPELRRHAAAAHPRRDRSRGHGDQDRPGESWSGNGTVNTNSAGSPTGIFDTYTTSGDPDGETFAPQFMYHGFQYVQISGLPDSFTATTPRSPACRPTPTSRRRLGDHQRRPDQHIHRMSEYSIRSNMQSIFTDCPHREKLGWLADMIQSMGAIHSNFDVSGFLRNMQRDMLESQQPDGLIPGTGARVPELRRRLPRRRQLGRRVHHHAVLPLADLRRHAHDARVLRADAGLPRRTCASRSAPTAAGQRPRRLIAVTRRRRRRRRAPTACT
jgi:alpha-L-rhamnosidase